MTQWHFWRVGDDKIEARARVEGDGGIIGDAFTEVAPGQALAGVSFEELVSRAPGVVKVDEEGRGRVMSNEGFYLDENGDRADAEIHDPIVEEGDRRRARTKRKR
jgi:hypothetical protein